MICAGGTGGHIFPGIAVAEAFLARDDKNEVVFVGTTGGLEGAIIPKAGFRLLYIKAHQFLGRSPLYKVLAIVGLLQGIAMSVAVLRGERPHFILGMGGFTCVPVIIAGVLMRIPCFLHEQNVEPGLANKFLSRITKKTFISFDETQRYLDPNKVSLSGNPLRRGLTKDHAEKNKGTFGIFVFGGSRGARSVNDAILTLLPYLESYKNMVMYHQTGREDFDRVNYAYRDTPVAHEVFPFTDEMEKYYRLSDIIISRAGATTIFELAYFRKAAVLIPYPYSAGNHQWKNASYVESMGGAHVVADVEATGERLFEIIAHLMKEPELLDEMGQNMGKIYVDDAASRIVGGIEHGLS